MNSPVLVAIALLVMLYSVHRLEMLPFCPFCAIKSVLLGLALEQWGRLLQRQMTEQPDNQIFQLQYQQYLDFKQRFEQERRS